MDMKDSVKRTNTTLFLLPLLGVLKASDLYNNAYIHDDKIVITSDNNVEYLDINEAITTVLPYFKEGKYSKFPNHCKQKILTFWGITSKEERVYQILYPESYFLEANMTMPKGKEIWPKPNMDEELYKYQNHGSDNNKSNKQVAESNEC